MIIAIIGMGRVGTSLAGLVVKNDKIDKVMLFGTRQYSAEVCKMHIASADPDLADKIILVDDCKDISSADVVVLTSGVQMKKDEKPQDVMKKNFSITQKILQEINFRSDAIIITLATPVDDITAFVAKLTGLPSSQILGFGGDLDRNRLISVLKKQSQVNANECHIIGEHGKNTIPVYPGEYDYKSVTKEVRNHLSDITAKVGSSLNLATAILLCNLIESIIADKQHVHYVTAFHDAYATFLTWPCIIGRAGITGALPIDIGIESRKYLADLLLKKKPSENTKLFNTNNTLFNTRDVGESRLTLKKVSKFSLVAVDLQNDFASVGGIKYNPERKSVIDFINHELMPYCFEFGIKIAEIISDDRLPRKCETKEYCVPGTWGYESIIPSTLKSSVWIKAMYSPDWIRKNIGKGELATEEPYADSEAFTHWLRDTIGNPESAGEVILFGLTLDCCVLNTALALHFRGYKIRILSEAVDMADSKLETKKQLLESSVIKKLASVIDWVNFVELASESNRFKAKL